MIRRSFVSETARSVALYSPCETYRYRLTRRWDGEAGEGGALTFVMLNPSTADERRNDPTIARCEARARALGFPAVDIVNLFAFRATRPQDLRRAAAPEGPRNAATLRRAARESGCIVAAWGVHGTLLGQEARVRALLSGHPLHALGVTRAGHPRHPLYLRADAPLRPWSGPDAPGAGAARAGAAPA